MEADFEYNANKEALRDSYWPIGFIFSLSAFQCFSVQENYPGTKLSISEWSSTADTDLTGGLLTVDVLGIWGKYGVDSSTYWATPDEMGPIGLVYWLFRG